MSHNLWVILKFRSRNLELISQYEEAKENLKNREILLKESKLENLNLKNELEGMKNSKLNLAKKLEQKIFEENESLFRKLRRAENDIRIITGQIDQFKSEIVTQEHGVWLITTMTS